MKTLELNYLDIVKEYEANYGLDTSSYDYEVVIGRGKYNKVVATNKMGDSKRAVAFIHRVTSHMFVAGSWSSPAKKRIA